MTRKKRIVTLLLVCFFTSFYYQGTNSTAYGEDAYQKTRIDPRDIYLSLEALCGCEGLPYEFMIPKEEYVKTKHVKDDLYVELDNLCGEGIPYILVIPRKHIKTKIDYKEDQRTASEELMSEDPTSLEVKNKE